MEGSGRSQRLTQGAPRSSLRRHRPNPIPDLRPLRTMPDASSGRPKPLRRRCGRCEMKVVIPGGSGQVGTILSRAFHSDGHDVIVLSRCPSVRPWRVVAWDGATPGTWQTEIDGCDVVINLTGRSVNCRYTAANRDEIMQSRLLSTRVVGQAIAAATCKPR